MEKKAQKKERIDTLLVERGYFASREKAKAAIMAGIVFADQERVDKAGNKIPVDANISVKGQVHPYVSRGGLKLEKAITAFQISLQDRIVLDIGASTGGFTDCALQHGARRVYAIDVGYGQLAWSLRQDERVVVMERTNFRYLRAEDLTGEPPDFATIDVSFISLRIILPALKDFLSTGGEVIALVKPQFEAGREQVGKKGIVRDKMVHKTVLKEMVHFAKQTGYLLKGLTYSPIQGGEGNIEFLMYLSYPGAGQEDENDENDENTDMQRLINITVEEAHSNF